MLAILSILFFMAVKKTAEDRRKNFFCILQSW